VSISYTYKDGGKVLICGNGGLASGSEHFAAELMGKYGRDVYIPCISLTCPSSLVTAWSNDVGFDDVFAHQVRVLGNDDDVFIGLTTSASPNILKACNEARNQGMYVYLIDKLMVGGEGVAEIQENILKFLHRVALEAKELCVENPAH